jgi:hypothetical protein
MTLTARLEVDTGPGNAPLAYGFTLQPGDTRRLWLRNLVQRTDNLARAHRGAVLRIEGENFALAYNDAPGAWTGMTRTPTAHTLDA